MKIVFVVIGTENLAVEFLSGYLKSLGHEVELVFDPQLFASEAVSISGLKNFFDKKEKLAKLIVSKNPDLVGFSVFTINYQRCLQLAKLVKKLNKNIPIIFGGIHPTSVPEVVIKEPCIDMVCVGEGEFALRDLLENKQGKTDIKNIWFKKGRRIIKNSNRSLISDLNLMPFPDKDLFYSIYPGFMNDDYMALSSRGCPFTCTYCGNNVLRRLYCGLGPLVRRRSPKNICDELVLMKRKYNFKKITFADDIFVQDIKWLKNFTKNFKKRVNLPYVMLTHPCLITYPIAKLLKESGCFLLMFGLQSACEKTRFNILKRYESNEQVLKAAQHCHKANLNFSIDHIFNIPTEGVREYEEAVVFYNKLRPSVIHSYQLQYFPGTEIIQTAIKEKIIKKSEVNKINRGLTSTSLVVGIGGKDNFQSKHSYNNFQLLFTILPLLPQEWVNFIIKHKLYFFNFSPPLILNVFFKFIVNCMRGRSGVYLGIIKAMIFFSKK